MSAELDTRLHAVARTPRLLVALDFDGTIAPHEDDPMSARMLPAARTAIDRLAALPDTTIALVSGRSMSDLRVIAEHDDRSPVYLAGSHGAEFWIPGRGLIEPDETAADIALRDRVRRHAEERVAPFAGVWIEPKTFGFAVHTRGARDAEDAARADDTVDELVAAEAPQWRRRTGKNILEFAFRTEGKDSAVAALREATGATAVLFAGDDVTDEDALRSLGPDDLGVHVGDTATAAAISVPGIEAFAGLLDVLADLRGSARQ